MDTPDEIRQLLINERESRIRAEADLKKAERRIQELEKKFTTALNASRILKDNVNFGAGTGKRSEAKGYDFDGDGIWHLDIKNRIASFSPGFCRKFGILNDELNEVLQRLRDIGDEESPSIIIDLISSNEHESDHIQTTCRLLTIEGEYRWVLEKAQIIERDAAGVPMLILGETIDITYQKQIEEEFKIIARRFSGLLENIQMGVLVEDENRTIALVNPTFCQLFDYIDASDKLLGKTWSAISPELANHFKIAEQFIERIEEVYQQRILITNEVFELANGCVLECDFVPIFIEDEFRGNLWKFRDITERKKQENKLRLREEKYRSIIENMNLGILEVNTDETIQYANYSFCEMSGFTLEELIGKNASTVLLHSDSAKMIEEKLELREKGISDAYEMPVKDRNGEDKWWLVSGAPRYNDEGELVGSIGIHLDITRQKHMQGELIEAKEKADQSVIARDSFIANMSHEIRTPMNAIIGLGALLSKTSLDAQQGNYLEHINTSAKNLLVILNDVLDYSKLDAGKLSVESIPFSLRETIQKSVDALGFKAEEKGVAVFFNFDNRIASWLSGDPLRLNQIMMNLLSNAIKFTAEGSITIQGSLLRMADGMQQVRLSVSDTGIGMEQEFLDKIFEKFTQEDQTVSKNYGGTGLGMTIVKELVRLMDGNMRIQSQKGAGTTITIEFPFAISEEPQLENAIPVVLPIEKLKGRKILLVEDNPTNRIVACSMMQPYGLEITEAEDGFDALEKLKNQLPDLILMDIQMPGMDGIETTIQIRKLYGNNIPIIALTANVLLPMQVKCRENGMNDFLAKPYEEEDLIAKICRGLQLEMKEGIPVLPSISSPDSSPVFEFPKELYNLNKLEKLSRGDTAFMKKMLGIFLNEVPVTLQRLESACNEMNYAEIKASAHRLKPSVTDMGIFSIKEILAETEIAAMEQEKSIIAKHQPLISSTIQEVLVQIKEKYEAALKFAFSFADLIIVAIVSVA